MMEGAASANTTTGRSESKYERLRKIGIGSYGVVFKCVNRQTGQVVAIKRYSENDSDPIIRKIAMREVRMLRQLKHSNLIQLIEVFRRKRRLHLVFDYCELTVLDVIEKYTQNCPLNLIKKIIWQLANGVSYCHQHNAGVVKLCDFGFARNIQLSTKSSSSYQGANQSGPAGQSSGQLRQLQLEREARLLGVPTATTTTTTSVNKENEPNERQALTEYVATRWYRAPELLVGEIYYDVKIDIWAIGCVTAELMRGEPVWPGKTDLDQLYMIKSSLGQLTASQTHTLLTRNLYDQANVERLLNQVASSNDALERKLPVRVGQPAVEFVLGCLQMDPARRPTSDELLRHHYIHSARMAQFVKGASHATGASAAAAASASSSSSLSHANQPLTGFSELSSGAPAAAAAAAANEPEFSRDVNLNGRGDTFNRSTGSQLASSLRSNSQALLAAANKPNVKVAPNAHQANKRQLPVATVGVSGSLTSSSKQDNWQAADGARDFAKTTGQQPSKTPAHKRKRQTSGGVNSSTMSNPMETKGSLVPISRRRPSIKQPAATELSVLQAKQAANQQQQDSSTKSNSKRRQQQPQLTSSQYNNNNNNNDQSYAYSATKLQQNQQAAGGQTKGKTTPTRFPQGNSLFRLNEEEPTAASSDAIGSKVQLVAPPVGRQSNHSPQIKPTPHHQMDNRTPIGQANGQTLIISPSGSSTATNKSNSLSSSVSTNATLSSSSSSSSFLPQVSNVKKATINSSRQLIK